MQAYKKKVVFSQPWGGLGDNLANTNLPRLFKDKNILFYISYLNYSRNKEIHNLCWSNNPFVKKRKKAYPTIGFKLLEESGYRIFDKKYNAIQNANALHGFNPGEGYPELFLNNAMKENYTSKFEVLIDTNAFSIKNNSDYHYDQKSFEQKINFFSSKKSYNIIYPNIYTNSKLTKYDLKISSLNQLINTLVNTNKFVCLNSGSHVLAATLQYLTGYPKQIISFNYPGHREVQIVNNKVAQKDGLYYFDNVVYDEIKIIKNQSTIDLPKTDVQINSKIRKNINFHRKILYYEKKIKTKIFKN